MKIRSGFVSNSSSSSFLVALPIEHECNECNQNNHLVTILEKLFTKSWSGLFEFGPQTREDHINKIDNEFEEIEQDIIWAENKSAILQKISNNQNAVKLFTEWHNINHKSSIRNWRYSDHNKNDQKNPNEEIEFAIRRVKCEADNLYKKKTELNRKKQLLLDSVEGKQKVYSFKLDVQSEEYRIMNTLIDSNSVKLIEKTTT